MTVASRSHRGNKARGSPYPQERAAAPGPWTCCLCVLLSPWTRFCPGRTQKTQVLSLTRSPLGPRNPSGPLSPLSPCSDKGGQERVNKMGGQVTLPRVAEARGTPTTPPPHFMSGSRVQISHEGRADSGKHPHAPCFQSFLSGMRPGVTHVSPRGAHGTVKPQWVWGRRR